MPESKFVGRQTELVVALCVNGLELTFELNVDRQVDDLMLIALPPHLDEPLQRYSPKAGLPLPEPTEGTLILLEVARLDAKQQADLLRWLDEFDQRSHVQVISTTSKPLFSLVEKGAFLGELYYKLNVVRIDLIGLGSAGRPARLPLD